MQEENNATEEKELQNFEERLKETYKNQTNIGWDKFIKGYISCKWGYEQEKFYRQTKEQGNRYNKDNWARQVIIGVQTFTMTLWKQRNEAIHGGPTKEARTIQREMIIKEVRRLFRENRADIPHTKVGIFKMPLRQRMKQGNNQLLLWIKICTLIISKSKERALEIKQRQKAITTYIPQWRQYTMDINYREESSNEETQGHFQRSKQQGKENTRRKKNR